MVKECTLLDGAQWFKSKNNVGFDQYSSFGKNKVVTIYCGSTLASEIQCLASIDTIHNIN